MSSEDEYVEMLLSGRRAYAWIMQRYGGMGAADAERAAVECYPYEPGDDYYRLLVFHEEPWHWAMLTLHGPGYVTDHPELVEPPPEYRALP
ncbi:hypothetical protein ABZ924_15515 [Streptomyces sp. NPDC046876]|uniref:hypothetical protein n=1 Tax=Streptomyces sp. NPDC046876 TaxID=3155616 RepID=UPI00340C7D09